MPWPWVPVATHPETQCNAKCQAKPATTVAAQRASEGTASGGEQTALQISGYAVVSASLSQTHTRHVGSHAHDRHGGHGLQAGGQPLRPVKCQGHDLGEQTGGGCGSREDPETAGTMQRVRGGLRNYMQSLQGGILGIVRSDIRA